MPKIEIKEIDETIAGESANDVDIAYIPGFSIKNCNCYIYNTIGSAPTEETEGRVFINTDTYDTVAYDDPDSPTAYQAPSIAVNIIDKKIWHCMGPVTTEGVTTYPWIEQTDISYVSPAPENSPTLCTTVDDFVNLFGKAPVQFKSAQSYPDGTSDPTLGFKPLPSPSTMYAKDAYEKSYIMAKELINAGIPVLYENVCFRDTTGKKELATVAQMYSAFEGDDSIFNELKDKGSFSIKYITSGAYPVFEYANNGVVTIMRDVASTRGDAVALIDHSNYPGRTLKSTDNNSVFAVAQTVFSGTDPTTSLDKFCAMFTPWAAYSLPNAPAGASLQILPASFAYLVSLGRSIQTNANWLAIAGVARGQVPYIVSLNTEERLTNTIADSYQERTGVAINAITEIRPYGLTIWGNRTCLKNVDNLVASSFLNIRNLVSDVKKLAYDTAKRAMFEQNSTVLWLNFKSALTPLLDRMQSGYGISGYKIIRQTTTEKAKVVALIRLYPVYAVEEFEITVVMSDEDVSVQ